MARLSRGSESSGTLAGRIQGKPVRRRLLSSKIHRARVTDANLNDVGTASIDVDLMAAADIRPDQQVAVVDIDNGARLETYAIEGRPGEICFNGASVRLVTVGDEVILLTNADYDESELSAHEPRVVHVDDRNVIVETTN